MSWLERIGRIGVNDTMPAQEVRHVVLINQAAALLAAIALTGVPLLSWTTTMPLLVAVISTVPVALLYLSRRIRTDDARAEPLAIAARLRGRC